MEKEITQLKQNVDEAMKSLDIAELSAQLSQLTERSQTADFWSDTTTAQDTMKQIAKLQTRVNPWLILQKQIDDLGELAHMQDEKLDTELQEQLVDATNTFEDLKKQLMYAGPYDDHDAIVSVHAGAGGTDAQDWAGMLLRMFVRYAEKAGFTTKMIDESVGEEAGIKSATFEVSGAFAFGNLKSEHGVHRLVRLSPFNADNLRQTSFAKVEVVPKVDAPDEVEIDEKDLQIDVFRSGGHGGQSVNTTDSAVRITHVPTNIVVAIQNERSQLQNKETAMIILRSKLAQLQLEQHAEKISELKGPNEQAAWGNQIRSYVLHPYKQVKDLRSRYETSDPDAVLDGDLQPLVTAYLEHTLGKE
jgi:peptide chain release factor 2